VNRPLYDSAPKDQRSSRTNSWKEQPGVGQITLGDTSPLVAMECSRRVNPCPFGHVIEALNRRMVEEWHGAQCMGGGSAVTRLYRLTLTYLRSRYVGFCHFESNLLSQRNIEAQILPKDKRLSKRIVIAWALTS
jgi:hypothetical protein